MDPEKKKNSTAKKVTKKIAKTKQQKKSNKNILKIYYHGFMKYIASVAFEHKDLIDNIVSYPRYLELKFYFIFWLKKKKITWNSEGKWGEMILQ